MDQIIIGTTHEILADHFWKDNLNHDIFLSVVSGETPELRCKSEVWFVIGKGGGGVLINQLNIPKNILLHGCEECTKRGWN